MVVYVRRKVKNDNSVELNQIFEPYTSTQILQEKDTMGIGQSCHFI